MGTTVLASGITNREGLHVYAQRMKGTPGGVAVMAINNDVANSQTHTLPQASLRYTFASTGVLTSKTVALNGNPLSLGNNDEQPQLNGAQTTAGDIQLQPATITFLFLPTRPACKP
ncbi:hypothetical protein [Pseudomonas sp. R5(2019)]|uniref:hypothetical protein n=1 Tax=Pseudomonas sp. R5(2019) TaxID=2697566 RepID=UPI001412E779|nr:hypothetical protein [Pseudomonas sp. R5(2019)]NBA95469.1 hypothetical protein [Pseudomonas sp. R5(2019)]